MTGASGAQTEPLAPPDRLLAWPQVKDLTGLSRTTAWRMQNAGEFPFPVVISPGRVGWREGEIVAWKASRAPRSEQLVSKRLGSEVTRKTVPQKSRNAKQTPSTLPLLDAAKTKAPQARRSKTQSPGQIAFEF